MPYPAQQIPVTVAQILKAAGHNAFARGERYYRAGHVLEAHYDPEHLTFSAKVSGNGTRPYSQTVLFPAEQVPHSSPFQSFCSCPVGTQCKHVVAALLGWFHEGGWESSGTEQPLRSTEPQESQSSRPSRSASTEQGPEEGTAAPDPRPDQAQTVDELRGLLETVERRGSPVQSSSWRRHLSRALQSQAVDHRTQASLVPAALDLRMEVPHRYGLGMGSPDAPAPVHLSARPLMLGRRGQWIKGGLNWDQFSARGHRGTGILPEHEAWLREFAAVLSADQSPYSSTHDWLVLDHAASPLLWDLLDRAGRIGLAMVVGGRQITLSLSPDAELGVRIETLPEGGLEVVPALVFPDTEEQQEAWMPATSAFPLGPSHEPQAYFALGGALHRDYVQRTEQSGAWTASRPSPVPELARDLDGAAWIEDGTELLFVPLGHAPTALALSLTGSGATAVPPSDVHDFAETFYPQVVQRVQLSVDPEARESLPEVLHPRLVLEASFRESTDEQETLFPVQCQWYWSYPRTGIRWEGQEDPERIRVPVSVGHPDPYRETRDPELEHTVLTQVRRALPEIRFQKEERSGWETRELVEQVLPALRDIEQVEVLVHGEVPSFRALDQDPQISVTVESTGDRDWFGLGVTIKAGQWYVPFSEIFRALDAGQKHLMLGDGSFFRLDRPEFIQLRELMAEARQLQDSGGDLRISRHQAGLWEDLEELATEVTAAQEWQESVSALVDLAELPETEVPPALTASLRPYQVEGFRWLAFLHDHGLGGILADDMGLGKTVQTIAMVLHAFRTWDGTGPRPRFLVVAPTSVAPNWAREIKKFAPTLESVVLEASSAKTKRSVAEMAAGADVVVTSYALLRLDEEGYRDLAPTGLVLDEAQFVKNARTQAHRAARDLPARFKLVVTGTPMENDLMELWSMFSIAAPGLFPSAKKFRDDYARPVSTGEDPTALTRLRRRIKPLMLRRSKERVAGDLPEKQEHRVEVTLTEEHQKIYATRLQRERQKVLGLLQDMDKNRFTIFQSLTALRRLALSPGLVDEEYAGVESAKLTYLQDQLPEIIEDGHKALVFSQFTTFLHQIAQALEEVGIPYLYLDGTTRRRGQVIEAFDRGEAPVFLISLKAGGFGLNLTEADYCFLMDPWWNPAAEEQAVDRAHRIGQKNNVMVYRLVSSGTIEEKVMKLKDSKAALFDAVMDEGELFSHGLQAEDIQGLLEG